MKNSNVTVRDSFADLKISLAFGSLPATGLRHRVLVFEREPFYYLLLTVAKQKSFYVIATIQKIDRKFYF